MKKLKNGIAKAIKLRFFMVTLNLYLHKKGSGGD
jgi:hypothetical protein